jgi:hypothetical protein
MSLRGMFVLWTRLIVGSADGAGEESPGLSQVAFEQVPITVLVTAGRHLSRRRLMHCRSHEGCG